MSIKELNKLNKICEKQNKDIEKLKNMIKLYEATKVEKDKKQSEIDKKIEEIINCDFNDEVKENIKNNINNYENTSSSMLIKSKTNAEVYSFLKELEDNKFGVEGIKEKEIKVIYFNPIKENIDDKLKIKGNNVLEILNNIEKKEYAQIGKYTYKLEENKFSLTKVGIITIKNIYKGLHEIIFKNDSSTTGQSTEIKQGLIEDALEIEEKELKKSVLKLLKEGELILYEDKGTDNLLLMIVDGKDKRKELNKLRNEIELDAVIGKEGSTKNKNTIDDFISNIVFPLKYFKDRNQKDELNKYYKIISDIVFDMRFLLQTGVDKDLKFFKDTVLEPLKKYLDLKNNEGKIRELLKAKRQKTDPKEYIEKIVNILNEAKQKMDKKKEETIHLNVERSIRTSNQWRITDIKNIIDTIKETIKKLEKVKKKSKDSKKINKIDENINKLQEKIKRLQEIIATDEELMKLNDYKDQLESVKKKLEEDSKNKELKKQIEELEKKIKNMYEL